MARKWKFVLVLAVMLLLAMSISLAWGAPQNSSEAPKLVTQGDRTPVFTAEDRTLVAMYYEHLHSTLAPGSLDSATFSPAVEKSLVAGSRVPMQLEKDLERLPAKLESQLSQITGDYGRYTVGKHIVLIRKADLAILDVVKNAGSK